MRADEIAPADFGVWPCCWPAVEAWGAMQTQWRTGPAGPVGLDYNVLPWVMEQIGIESDERPAIFADLRVMELAALEAMHSR